MSQRYPGNIVRATPTTPTGPAQNGSAPGVWTLDQAQYWLRQGLWPIAGNPVDGTFAVFALGSNNCGRLSAREKYTYANCSTSAATPGTATSANGSAVGNATVGIFALGTSCAGDQTAIRNKYTYATDVVTTASSANVAGRGGTAAGTSTVGIFALGMYSYYCCCIADSIYIYMSNRNKYTYSGDVSANTTYANNGSGWGAATSSGTVGIFAIGASAGNCDFVPCAGGLQSARNKYTYAGDTNASATAATTASYRQSAAGNSTFGIFALGRTTSLTTTTRNKYTYAGDTNAAATAATLSSAYGSAAGNSTRGIFTLGYVGGVGFSNVRNRYTYAGDTVVAATAAVVAAANGAAASNGIAGVTM